MTNNYIFDFYGTLVDIHTDELKQLLWQKLVDIYQSFGVSYSLDEIKDSYSLLCQKEIKRMESLTGYDYPEIDLLNVFGDLMLKEDTNTFVSKPKEERKQILFSIAKQFRNLSRDYIKLYPHTLEVLKTLKQRGNKVYLLSNAQISFTLDEINMVGLYDYFDKIYISSTYSMKKPQKEFLQLVIHENDLKKEETIMIGNEIQSDIEVAYLNDIQSVLLNTDHFSKETIEKQTQKYKNNGYQPIIIDNGDIKEVLNI